VTRVRWETLRTKPAVTAGEEGNWRLDPALAGGGVLFDHGWHALYVVHALLPAAPESVAATLETRRHRVGALEDTASLRLAGRDFTAEVFLTWAADERRNTLVVEGEEASLHLDGDTLDWRPAVGPVERTRFPKSVAEGSHHPDWFGGVIEDFLAEVGDPAVRGRSLAEAGACLRTLRRAQESHEKGGAPVELAR
jgi:predicted dehydrogenase